jgi:hypothetical protein
MANPGVEPSSGATVVATLKRAPTVPEALIAWLATVVLFSAVALAGPFFAPWVHTGHVSTTVSFGKGELLGFALAISAASLGRCVISDVRWNAVLRPISAVFMALVAAAITAVWIDDYTVYTHASKELFLPEAHVVTAGWVLVALALICGAITEAAYALSSKDSAVGVS